MPKIPIIKPKDFLAYLLKFDCNIVNVKGSHYKIVNNKNNKISVLPLHSEDLKRGTFAGILKQLDIDIDEFINFIFK